MRIFESGEIHASPSWHGLADLSRDAQIAAEVPRGDHMPPPNVLESARSWRRGKDGAPRRN